ncbi:MAG TPA: 3-isopropylmalate dehydratase small subunit [Hyphomicrobiaceae bacterium]
MRPLQTVEGRMVPLDKADIDTDQIMPVQFLKHPERRGFAQFLFHNWMEEPDFVLNDSRYEGANILVCGPNFGCGSSREHAPWGLQEYGFDVVVAPSFGDIFRMNCAKIGLLCAATDSETSRELIALASTSPETRAKVDLSGQTITAGGITRPFKIDAYSKKMLIEGLDHIEQTLRHVGEIDAYEASRPPWLPSTHR